MDHHRAARTHIQTIEARIANQRRLIEVLEAAGRDTQDVRQRLELMERALSAMHIELARLLPTAMDASRPNYREAAGHRRMRRLPHRTPGLET
jgi:hypothetical protein